LAIGNPSVKKKVHQSLSNAYLSFPTLIHPLAQIGNLKYNSIGIGCLITANNVITVNTNIGDFVILNLACTVGHDSVIRAYCSFMPGVNISGEVLIEEGVYVGTGAKIINQLEIGKETIIGAGAVVSKSIPEKCTAVGIPAKPIKFH